MRQEIGFARVGRWLAGIAASVLCAVGIASAQAPATAATPAAPAAEAAKPAAPPAGDIGLARPGWNVPPKWDSVDRNSAYVSVKGRETDILIQGSGHDWRKFRNGPLTLYGGWLIVLVPALIMLYFMIKGPIKTHDKPTGRLIERFNSVERVAHWTMAISFMVLAISGLVLLFGKHVLIPIFGHGGNAAVTVFLKNVHNFVGPLFIFSIVVFFMIFARDNIWRAHDWLWVKKAGGLFSGEHVPSHRFNAGEKSWFWLGVVLLGAALSVSGLILNFPNWNQGRELMQTANIVHAIAAVVVVAMSFGHIYMGTIGVKDAYASMRDGKVDETWAKEHHELWYNDYKAGKLPGASAPERSSKAAPAAGDD